MIRLIGLSLELTCLSADDITLPASILVFLYVLYYQCACAAALCLHTLSLSLSLLVCLLVTLFDLSNIIIA